MADAPFAPWASGGSVVDDDRYWEVREFGDIYAALGARSRADIDGIDALFVYEVAALLGIDKPETVEDEYASDLANMSPGARLAIERLRAEQEGRPAPEAKPLDPSVVAFMQHGLGG